MKKNRREGKKSGVSEEDTPKPETENLRHVRYVRRVSRERSPTPDSEDDDLSTLPPRPAHADDGWECVMVGKEGIIDGKKEDRRHKNGCIIIDHDDCEYVWKKREVHSDGSNENFLNKIGAKISKATASKRLKCRQPVKKKKKALDGTPPGYYPLKGLKTDAGLAGLMRKCASLAIADYNGQALTDYRFVDIETVGWQIVAGTMYCIIFRARANGQDHTFKACVIKRRVGRLEKRKVYVILVDVVVMMKPGSIERSGTLQELIN